MKPEGAVSKHEIKGCCSARTVLWFLVFIGCSINFMVRINMNIAIVSMVKPINYTVTLSQCRGQNASNLEDSRRLTIKEDSSPIFEWNEQEQSNVLGAFYWLEWAAQIPGGVLGMKYGAKKVFGIGNFIGVLLCFLIPQAAYRWHVYLMIIRALQGFSTGFTFTALNHLTAKWTPPNERSKFVTAYMGSSMGTAMTYLICGFLIEKYGWESVFYFSGITGTLWFISWWSTVFDSPSQHPRISEEEKNYILDSLGETVTKKAGPVPWKCILTSVPVWMNIIAQLGCTWGFFTLLSHGPSYFKFIQGLDIRSVGLLSGVPHLIRIIWALMCSQAADYLLRTNKMRRTNVRKAATVCCTILQGLVFLVLAQTGCNHFLAILAVTLAITVSGAISTGPWACLVDLTPNYSSVLQGIVFTSSSVSGFATPVIVGYFTLDNQTEAQWQKVFWVSSGILISTGIIYAIFGSAELQQWNSPNIKEEGFKLVQKVKEERIEHQFEPVIVDMK